MENIWNIAIHYPCRPNTSIWCTYPLCLQWSTFSALRYAGSQLSYIVRWPILKSMRIKTQWFAGALGGIDISVASRIRFFWGILSYPSTGVCEYGANDKIRTPDLANVVTELVQIRWLSKRTCHKTCHIWIQERSLLTVLSAIFT